MNMEKLVKYMDELHVMVHSRSQDERERIRVSNSKEGLDKFSEGDYAIVASDELFKG